MYRFTRMPTFVSCSYMAASHSGPGLLFECLDEASGKASCNEILSVFCTS